MLSPPEEKDFEKQEGGERPDRRQAGRNAQGRRLQDFELGEEVQSAEQSAEEGKPENVEGGQVDGEDRGPPEGPAELPAGREGRAGDEALQADPPAPD